MTQERQGMAEETSAVPGQRAEQVPPPAEPEQPPGQTAPQPAVHASHDHKIRHTRLSGTWAAVIAFGIVLLLLLIFILQNQNKVQVSYFGAHGHLPLGVSLLLAAVAGILLVALAGSARIMQLRATARKHRRAHEKARR
jgi:lipopolysaccharide assembly protein A